MIEFDYEIVPTRIVMHGTEPVRGTISLLMRPHLNETVIIDGKRMKVTDVVHTPGADKVLLKIKQEQVGSQML